MLLEEAGKEWSLTGVMGVPASPQVICREAAKNTEGGLAARHINKKNPAPALGVR